MSESAATKGIRYLTEGRLTVQRVNDQRINATCRGGGAVHRCGYEVGRGWYCTCPARTTCSHLIALQHVTAIT
jgi:uncharacterized Zn finger protein